MDSIQREHLIRALVNQRVDEDMGDPLLEEDASWEHEAEIIKAGYSANLQKLGNADLWREAGVTDPRALSEFIEEWL